MLDFALLVLIATGLVTWLSAEPDGVAAGVRGATTRAFSDGWSAGSQSASRRWQAGEADRTARRKRRHKTWRRSRKGRALIAADNAGRATIGAAARGARIVVPAAADAIRAGSEGARQGWTARRKERAQRQKKKAKKRQKRAKGRAAAPSTPGPQDATKIDPGRIEWATNPARSDHSPDSDAHAPNEPPQGSAGQSRPGYVPSGTTQEDDVSENHLDLLKKLQGEADALDGASADMRQQVQAATEEAEQTTRDAAQLADAVGGDVFGGNVQKAVGEVTEAAKQVEQNIQALREAMEKVEKSIEALREAIEAAQQAVKAAVGS